MTGEEISVRIVGGSILASLACVVPSDPPTETMLRPISASDALFARDGGPEPALPCGPVGAEGCCESEVLFWCADGGLHYISCALRARCGWRARGLYDCDTAGSADPEGRFPKACSWGDAGVPLDAATPGADQGCGQVSVEGCCSGEILQYCERGHLQVIPCTLNLACGWGARSQLYNCGTAGGADPSGLFPRDCPGPAPDISLPEVDEGPGDATPETYRDVSADAGDRRTAAESGCGCATTRLAGRTAVWPALLVAAMLGWRRRHSCCYARRACATVADLQRRTTRGCADRHAAAHRAPRFRQIGGASIPGDSDARAMPRGVPTRPDCSARRFSLCTHDAAHR